MRLNYLEALYAKHGEWLGQQRQAWRLEYPLFDKPQTDDIEAEIAAMLCREFVKTAAVEFSPFQGWSTAILLSAMPHGAQLWSYDLNDHCSGNVRECFDPNYLTDSWRLFVGDAQQHYEHWIKSGVDMLFIDSDHTAKFAKRYVKELLEPMHAAGKTVPVYVHDVFRRGDGTASEEGIEVINFLVRHAIPCLTASPFRGQRSAIMDMRPDTKSIHNGWRDPAIFFFLGEQPCMPSP